MKQDCDCDYYFIKPKLQQESVVQISSESNDLWSISCQIGPAQNTPVYQTEDTIKHNELGSETSLIESACGRSSNDHQWFRNLMYVVVVRIWIFRHGVEIC